MIMIKLIDQPEGADQYFITLEDVIRSCDTAVHLMCYLVECDYRRTWELTTGAERTIKGYIDSLMVVIEHDMPDGELKLGPSGYDSFLSQYILDHKNDTYKEDYNFIRQASRIITLMQDDCKNGKLSLTTEKTMSYLDAMPIMIKDYMTQAMFENSMESAIEYSSKDYVHYTPDHMSGYYFIASNKRNKVEGPVYMSIESLERRIFSQVFKLSAFDLASIANYGSLSYGDWSIKQCGLYDMSGEYSSDKAIYRNIFYLLHAESEMMSDHMATFDVEDEEADKREDHLISVLHVITTAMNMESEFRELGSKYKMWDADQPDTVLLYMIMTATMNKFSINGIPWMVNNIQNDRKVTLKANRLENLLETLGNTLSEITKDTGTGTDMSNHDVLRLTSLVIRSKSSSEKGDDYSLLADAIDEWNNDGVYDDFSLWTLHYPNDEFSRRALNDLVIRINADL